MLVLAAASTVAMAAVGGALGGSRGAPNGQCSAPALPGTVVDVTLTDMGGMMVGGRWMMNGYVMGGPMRVLLNQSNVRAGQVSFRVVNSGSLVHELVVLPLAAGHSVGARAVSSDGTADESGSLGEVSRTCAASSGDGIDPGGIGWTTLTLSPGNFELICNRPGHYAAGMFAELVVS